MTGVMRRLRAASRTIAGFFATGEPQRGAGYRGTILPTEREGRVGLPSPIFATVRLGGDLSGRRVVVFGRGIGDDGRPIGFDGALNPDQTNVVLGGRMPPNVYIEVQRVDFSWCWSCANRQSRWAEAVLGRGFATYEVKGHSVPLTHLADMPFACAHPFAVIRAGESVGRLVIKFPAETRIPGTVDLTFRLSGAMGCVPGGSP